MERPLNISESSLVISAYPGSSNKYARKLVKAEARATFDHSVMHKGEYEDPSTMRKDSKKIFWAPGITRVQPSSLVSHQQGRISALDVMLNKFRDKYKRIAEDMMIKARSSGDSGAGLDLFEKFLTEFDDNIRPIMNDNVDILRELVEEVRETSSFYGDVEKAKKQIKRYIDKGDNLDAAIEKYYRTNISPMGIVTQGDLTGLFIDSIWPILDRIDTQYMAFISILGIDEAMSSGIGMFATFRGYDRIFRKIISDGLTRGQPQYSYTQLGDEHHAWTNNVLAHTFKEISSKNLHVLLPNMECTTVLGPNSSQYYNYISRVLDTRPSLISKSGYYRRFKSERPTPIGASQADRWLRAAYVRVKIPMPKHDKQSKDIIPGEVPEDYKYVWGIRIVVGGASKGPPRGAANYGERGYNKNLIRHMDTYRTDLLINLYVKSEARVEPTEKPWKQKEPEFKLLQLAYKPPEEAKIYRLISPLTVLTSAIDILREDIASVEWKRIGLSPDSPIITESDSIIRYKIRSFIAFVKFTLIYTTMDDVLPKSLNSMLSRVKSISTKGNEEDTSVMLIKRNIDALMMMSKAEVQSLSLSKKTPNGTRIVTSPVGLLRFIRMCKEQAVSILDPVEDELVAFGITNKVTENRVRFFLRNNIVTAFSGILDYHTHNIARDIHQKTIYIYPITPGEPLERLIKVPENKESVKRDITFNDQEGDSGPEGTYTSETLYSYLLREHSYHRSYFEEEETEDKELPMGRGKLSQLKKDSITFRRIAKTNPPPVIITLFDSGAPDARDIQEYVSDPSRKEFYAIQSGSDDFREFPTKYWKTSNESIENMPMSYDMEYDVDGYIDLDLTDVDDDSQYIYDLEQMEKDADDISGTDDTKMKEAVEFIKDPENRFIYMTQRSEKLKSGKKDNPYFTKGSERKKDTISKKATIAFCDIRSLIGRSSLGGVLHFNGRINLNDELKGKEGNYMGFESSPSISATFRHLQWPKTSIFHPLMEGFTEGKTGMLHVEVIAKYDTGVRWKGEDMKLEMFQSENWNRTESWGLSKSARRQVEIPIPPRLTEELSKAPIWRRVHYKDSFPAIFKHFDEIDVRRWRRVAEISGVGTLSKVKKELESDNALISEISYCGLRFLPREIPNLKSGNPLREALRHAINSSDDRPLIEKYGSITTIPIPEERVVSMMEFEREMGRTGEEPEIVSTTVNILQGSIEDPLNMEQLDAETTTLPGGVNQFDPLYMTSPSELFGKGQ